MVCPGLCSNDFAELHHEINDVLLVAKDGVCLRPRFRYSKNGLRQWGFRGMFVLPRYHSEIVFDLLAWRENFRSRNIEATWSRGSTAYFKQNAKPFKETCRKVTRASFSLTTVGEFYIHIYFLFPGAKLSLRYHYYLSLDVEIEKLALK